MSFIASIVSLLFGVYEFLIFVRVLISWINTTDPSQPVIDHPILVLLEQITDPVLVPLRRLIPPIRLRQSSGAELRIDITPFVAIIILEVVRRIIEGILLAL